MKGLVAAPRGTKDIYGEDLKYFLEIEKIAFNIAQLFGFKRIITPTFESENLFKRAVGGTTDVVQKEMFSFTDRADRKLALRPEGTAGVARAVIETGLIDGVLPLKLCYLESCFRNERPQAGRYKEFYQFGAEIYGPISSLSDAEGIIFANNILKSLKISGLILKINSIGCSDCREKYIEKLKEYFLKQKDELCESCKVRLDANPLRLLDCKGERCGEIVKKAPKIIDYLCDECKENFRDTQTLLDSEKIKYTVDPLLVRGLDYYKGIVFEFISNELGAQSAVCGGGRYDGLIELLGGKPVPALGFAIGIERLILILKKQNTLSITNNDCDLFIGTIGKTAKQYGFALANLLRAEYIKAELEIMERSVKAQMKYANKIGAKFSIIIGDDEVKSGKVKMKDMVNKKEYEIELDQVKDKFRELKGNSCEN